MHSFISDFIVNEDVNEGLVIAVYLPDVHIQIDVPDLQPNAVIIPHWKPPNTDQGIV